MVSVTEQRKKRGPVKGSRRPEPYHPKRVLKMVRLRASGLTLQEVANVFDITPAGVLHIVERWGAWAKKQKEAE